MEITVTSENFQQQVLQAEQPVLVDFWATWCGPCRMLAPVLEQIAAERRDIRVCKINVDEQPVLAQQFQIDSIPTLLIFRDGKLLGRMTGYCDKQTLLQRLDSALQA
ncbi:thioredoxin [Ruminococcus sp.]|uniref:thioredoxin n=1 Tax=Ruminococcus sp. TaxID=41978 RepID=UPI003F0CB8A9